MSGLASIGIACTLLVTIAATPIRAIGQGLGEEALILVLTSFNVVEEETELLIFVTPHVIRNADRTPQTTAWHWFLLAYSQAKEPCTQVMEVNVPTGFSTFTAEVRDGGESRSLVIDDEEFPLRSCFDSATRATLALLRRIPPDKADEIRQDPAAAGLVKAIATVIGKAKRDTKTTVRTGKPLLVIAEDVEGEAL